MKDSLIAKLQTPLAVTIMLLCLTPLIIKGVTLTSAGASLHTGPLYAIFLAYIVQGAVVAARNFFYQGKATNSLIEKNQIRLVLTGLLLYAFFAVASNVLLPIISDNWQSSRYGPLFSLFMVGLTAYAIVKHKLFDIRLIVARSFAYLLSLTTLGGLFILAAFSVTNIFFNGNRVDVVTLRWLYAVLAVVLALLFPYLKQFFDKVTSRLFFRDAYDTQAFLDEFNKTLVITYELNQLLKQSAALIEENIKPTYCLFVINETENTQARTMGTMGEDMVDKKYINEIKETVGHTKQKLIVTDELDEKYRTLQGVLRKKDVALLARLAVSSTAARAGVGYLMIGPKKSGNLYSSQDLKVIEIIANELVIAIQNALRFEEIEHFNVTLQQKVDDATRKLRHANEKLKAMDETKDDFISMASHQLRTPLTSVKGYISMIMEGDAGKVTHMQREMLGQAFFSSQRMVYLIADLLNVSRLKTGKFVIESSRVNLAEVVEQELAQLEETAASRSLTLEYKKPADFPDLMLDETKIRQVIMNFADNAIYYTPAGGHIVVQLVNNPTTVELKVIDNGIGVPKSEQHHLFTKFYRAGNARKARPDGTGLGLFMAKKVVVAQGGSLIFESQEGKGSTFGFIFSKRKLGVSPAKNGVKDGKSTNQASSTHSADIEK